MPEPWVIVLRVCEIASAGSRKIRVDGLLFGRTRSSEDCFAARVG